MEINYLWVGTGREELIEMIEILHEELETLNPDDPKFDQLSDEIFDLETQLEEME